MKLYVAIYRFAIFLYFSAIRIASLFNDKAKLFIEGRKDIFSLIRARMAPDTRQSIWMHCASLGEFEQGRPVLESLRVAYPQYAIVLTFFSPSGYEVRKDYDGADYIFYLPIDSNRNAKQLLDLFNPAVCIFVKYEFWYYYLANIASRKIPVVLISAIFNEKQGFFKWYGALQRRMLRYFSHIFVQDNHSAELLNKIKIDNVSVSGDTRFDRVITAAAQTEGIPTADAFTAGHKILIAGSTWKEDEQFIHKALAQLPTSWKLVLVPHEVDKEHIAAIEKLFGNNTVRWSQAKVSGLNNKRVLLVDEVGFLLQLYRYGTVAWIGGGFGKDGIHNVLEAAVYGIPCFYGPIFHKFLEAKDLIEKGGAFTVTDVADFVDSLQQFDDDIIYQQHAAAAKGYVLSKGGATNRVVGYLKNIGI